MEFVNLQLGWVAYEVLQRGRIYFRYHFGIK